MSQADNCKRLEECQTELEESKRRILRLEQDLRKAKQQRDERAQELGRLQLQQYDEESKLPPWERARDRGNSTPLCVRLKMQYKWQVLLTDLERKDFWEQWCQSQQDGKRYDETSYNERVDAAYAKMLTDKMKHLHDFLGNPKFEEFSFDGANCRRFVEMAVIEHLDDKTSPYDWLMQHKHPEIMQLLRASVVSDAKSIDEQDEKCREFYDAVFELH